MLSTLERSDLKNFQSNALTSSPVALERPSSSLGVMPELLEADIPLNSLHRASDGLGSIPEPNNTLGTAYNIGVLSGTRSFTDFVGSSDTNDYYRFSLNGTSNFTLNLSGLSADADVEVIRDGNGNLVRDAYEVIGASTNGGASPESIILRGLAADTYYIRVNPYGSANTNYTLNLTATLGLGVAPEPNNNLSQAYTISPATHPWIVQAYLNGTRQFSGWVGSTDTNDYYRFSLGTPSNINLALTGMSADADLQLLNSSGGLIQESSRGGSLDDSINREALTEGTYYVRVYQWLGDTNYRLSLSTLKPSNLLPVETNIGTLSGFRSFSDRVDTTDTADVFRFAIGGTRNVNLILTGMSADADLRLIRDVNSNGLVDSGDEIVRSIRGSNSPEWISRSLGAGTYFAQVYQYSGNTNYNLRLFALADMGIGNLLQSAASDYNVSRNETIGILRNAKDGGVIDSTELSELRTIVAETRPFMADYVFNLSNKIVNANTANKWWTGGASTRQLLAPESPSQNGNLYAGATSSHMERLISKWFLGLDRPAIPAGIQYRPMSGSLIQNGIAYGDVVQGALGDCYFCAALAGAAFRRPATVQSMFIDNLDGTFTVRFYNNNNGQRDYVTVDRYLPTDASGNRLYMGWGGGSNTATTNELWAALAERAYAQINESAWMNRDQTNSYAGIEGGWPDTALSQITAQGTVRDLSLTDSDRTNIINQFNAGRTVFLNWAAHALTMVGYNASTQLFRIYNPWGVHYNLTWAQILNGGGGSQRYTDWSYSTT